MRSLLAVLAALLVMPTPAVAADELIAPVGGPIDATGTHLAYSRPDGPGFKLVVDGKDAPVAPSPKPFDVDLGTDARGRLVAVYTRRHDSRDVVWLDVASGRERRVPAAARSGRDEKAPSVSRGRVLFAAKGRRRDRLYMTSLTGSGVRRLPVPSGTRRGCSPDPPSPSPCVTLTVTHTELAGGVLAFTAVEGDDDGIQEISDAQLWFARVGHGPRLLLRGPNSVNQGTTLLAPQVSSRWVTAGLFHEGSLGTSSRAVRVSPASGTKQRAALPDLPEADVDSSEPQRELQGLGLGAGAAYTTTCFQPDDVKSGTDPACRLVRTALRWR